MLNHKPVILIFPFNLMSHYLRCITLAEQLSPYYEVRFATSPTYAQFIQNAGFTTFSFNDFDPAEILAQSQEFRFDWLEENALLYQYEQQKAIIKQHSPVAVIGDNSFALKMAAEKCDVKFISLMNAYMTKYYKPGRKLTRLHPKASLMELLPDSSYWYIINKVEHYHFNHIHAPFKKIREREGLKIVSSYADELEGEITLLCDLPDLFPQHNQPNSFHFIGPLLYTLPESCAMPYWDIPKNEKKKILVSMGSSGDFENLKWLNEPVFSAYHIITTGDKNQLLNASHITSFEFLPLGEVMPLVDILLCHGGNGTIYEALRAGVPILCSPSIFEQEWNEYAILKHNLGDTLTDVNSADELLHKLKKWDDKKLNTTLVHFKELLQNFKPEISIKQLITNAVFA